MIEFTEITSEPNQNLTLIGENGENIEFNLRYMPSQESWFCSFTYEDFTINGLRVVNSPNFIRNFKNILPFGIGCTLVDKSDPYFIDDFSTGRAKLVLLTSDEVEQIEGAFFT